MEVLQTELGFESQLKRVVQYGFLNYKNTSIIIFTISPLLTILSKKNTK